MGGTELFIRKSFKVHTCNNETAHRNGGGHAHGGFRSCASSAGQFRSGDAGHQRSFDQHAGPAGCGANSFTEAQAISRIEAAGFSDVTGLAKDKDGIWRGKAMKAGALSSALQALTKNEKAAALNDARALRRLAKLASPSVGTARAKR